MYGIQRRQHASGTWYYGVSFSRRGKPYEKRFYDPKHGGRVQARRAALAWRDAQLARAPVLTIVEFSQLKRSNNTSGVPGVHFLTSERQPQGIWQAKLKLAGGTYTRKSFSVRLNGTKAAYALAVAARTAMLASAQDRPFLRHAVAKRMATRPRST